MNRKRRFVIGDIHGCNKTFQSLVKEKLQLTREDTLYLLGDYIDRGPDSRGVLDFILELQAEEYDVRPIIGNHEYMLLLSLDDEHEFAEWRKNGSIPTLLSFGITEEFSADPVSIHEIPQKYIDLLCQLKYHEEDDDFFFVHAGLAKGISSPADDLETLLWSRKEVYNRSLLKHRILLHGHTPVPLISIQDRLYDSETRIINLDGGCVYPNLKGFGFLVGMNLDTFELHFQKNME